MAFPYIPYREGAGPYAMMQWLDWGGGGELGAIPSSKGREGPIPLHHGIGILPLQTDEHTQLKTLPSHNLRMRAVTSKQHYNWVVLNKLRQI